MATGYTHPVKDGKVTTLSEFAWMCSRAFGALIHLRDDAPDTKDPGDPPEDHAYAEKTATEAAAELATLEARDDAAWDAAFRAENEAIAKANTERVAEAETTRQRYESLLTQVLAWKPPTPDHEKFREFMVDQLQSSIKHDCEPYMQPLWQNASDYKTKRLVWARDWAARSQAELTKAKVRSSDRIRWVQELRRSLEK